jgi:hypothetical protein
MRRWNGVWPRTCITGSEIMTAAGVQNIDSAGYLPPRPSTSSAPDPKGAAAADSQASDAPGEPSDFQSELELHQSAAQPTGAQQTGKPQDSKPEPKSAGTAKDRLAKSDSGKLGKKSKARREDANLIAAIPVQVVEPQKQILPLLQAPALPRENANLDNDLPSGWKATPDGSSSEPMPQAAQAPAPAVAASKLSVNTRPSVESLPNRKSPSSAGPFTLPDPSMPQVSNASVPAFAFETPLPEKEINSGVLPSRDEIISSVQPDAPAENQPAPRTHLRISASAAEPVVAAVQETTDAAPSRPSVLAFAARMSAVAQNSGQPVALNAAQRAAADPTSQTTPQIPVRYAATAQIIPSATVGTKPNESKRVTGAELDPTVRPDAHFEIRTDMVMPRTENASQPAPPASAPAAPQQPQPSAHMEPVIGPPAAPPASNHDIRVHVPDNNGGSTQVRFVESGGEVRVSVRTADEGLAQNLRTHLNDLTQRLSDGGMPAEIWKPAANAASSSQNDQHQPHQDGRGSGGQGSGGHGQEPDRQQKRPAWLDQMEASLQGEQN